jgi:hypothetical protein
MVNVTAIVVVLTMYKKELYVLLIAINWYEGKEKPG